MSLWNEPIIDRQPRIAASSALIWSQEVAGHLFTAADERMWKLPPSATVPRRVVETGKPWVHDCIICNYDNSQLKRLQPV